MSSNVVEEVKKSLPEPIGTKPLRGTHSHPAAYALIHTTSGQVYVGSTKDLYKRISQHRTALRASSHKNRNLQEAYDRDPRFNLTYKATETPEEALDVEQELITNLMSTGKLLNRSPDARLANKGVALSEEAKEAIRQRTQEQFSSQEARRRHSELSRDKWQDPEYRAKQMGKPKSVQTRETISTIMKDKWKDPEYRKKMSGGRAKPVVIDGIRYPSLTEASKQLQTPVTTLRSRMSRQATKLKQ